MGWSCSLLSPDSLHIDLSLRQACLPNLHLDIEQSTRVLCSHHSRSSLWFNSDQRGDPGTKFPHFLAFFILLHSSSSNNFGISLFSAQQSFLPKHRSRPSLRCSGNCRQLSPDRRVFDPRPNDETTDLGWGGFHQRAVKNTNSSICESDICRWYYIFSISFSIFTTLTTLIRSRGSPSNIWRGRC